MAGVFAEGAEGRIQTPREIDLSSDRIEEHIDFFTWEPERKTLGPFSSLFLRRRVKSNEGLEKLRAAKLETKRLMDDNRRLRLDFEQIVRSSKSLLDFVSTSERYRKKYSEQLRKCKCEADDQQNIIFELKQNKTLTNISYEILQAQLLRLYESVDGVSNTKKVEDTLGLRVTQKANEIKTLRGEKADMTAQIGELFGQKTNVENDCMELINHKRKIEATNTRTQNGPPSVASASGDDLDRSSSSSAGSRRASSRPSDSRPERARP